MVLKKIIWKILLILITLYGSELSELPCSGDIDRSCDSWDNLYPDGQNFGSCGMKVHANSSQQFGFQILSDNSNFMQLKLHFVNKQGSIQSMGCFVEPLLWIWTYVGYGGARQYLNWPMEYSVWSLGLLDSHTSRMNVSIEVDGNCQVTIGEKNTTSLIGSALRKMVDSLNVKGENEKYRQSFFCYKERIYLNEYIYSLCLHITCPFEAIGYKCCHTSWDHSKAKYITQCPGQHYYFESIWWLIPFIAGTLIYLFLPIILFKFGENIKDGMAQHSILDKIKMTVLSRKRGSVHYNVNESTPLCESTDINDTEINGWIFESPVSMGAIISRPFRRCFIKFPICSSRTVRFLFSMITMIFILLKIILHGMFHREFIVESVKRGVPMDFLSVFAGYTCSKYNFMRELGGPYIACGMYLFCLTLSLCIPKDFAIFIEKGIPNNDALSTTPLTLDTANKLRFASISDFQSAQGYRKMYKTMILHFLMLLNPDFWKHVVRMQKDRWFGFIAMATGAKPRVLFYIFGLPIYVALCMLEIVLCFLYYGIPVVFWSYVTLRAYCLPIWRKFKSNGFWCMFLGGSLIVVQATIVLFIVYFFTIVFVDSFVFISRVIVFTYTGLFAYPSVSFAYIIFAFSVIMYGTDSIKTISKVYCDLFERTKSICKRIHEDKLETSRMQILINRRGCFGIPRDLFQFMIDRHRPIRYEIFMSSLKISILVFVLYVSVSLLQSFKSSYNMHTLTEALSTIFICFCPKLLKEICVFNKNKTIREFDWALEDTIKDFHIMKCRRKYVVQPQRIEDEENQAESERQNDSEVGIFDNL